MNKMKILAFIVLGIMLIGTVMANNETIKTKEIKFKEMPIVASAIALEKLQSLNFSIVLKEVGNKTSYEITAKKQAKILWLFNKWYDKKMVINEDLNYTIKGPWWTFLITKEV